MKGKIGQLFCSFVIVRRDRQTEEEVIVDVVQTTDVKSVISYYEWNKVWSRLSAHFQPFSDLGAYFNNFRQ